MTSESAAKREPILITGLPRSGTTWIGEVLASARGTLYVYEPDNEALSPIAWLCKREMHRFPYLTATDSAPEYHRLWQAVIQGNRWAWYLNAALGLSQRRVRRSGPELEAYVGEKTGLRYMDRRMHRVGAAATVKPFFVERHRITAALAQWLVSISKPGRSSRRTIIKSVHSSLSMDWIASNFPVNVVVVLRNPYGLYASYRRMRLPDGFRNLLLQPTLQRDIAQYLPQSKASLMSAREDPVAFQIMLMYKVIESRLPGHPDWTLVSHDRLCIRPRAGYEDLFSRLHLALSGGTHTKMDALNRPGKGFDPQRVSEQEPFKWKSELTTAEQASVKHWIDVFCLKEFFEQHIDPA